LEEKHSRKRVKELEEKIDMRVGRETEPEENRRAGREIERRVGRETDPE
jgi:hypothetical protein